MAANKREDTKDRHIREQAVRCAQLTRQHDVLERKLALSQADRVIDTKSKEELERHERHAKKRDGWEEKERDLEVRMEELSANRDGLTTALEDCNSV